MSAEWLLSATEVYGQPRPVRPRAGSSLAPDESIDDAWTGTAPRLSRAQSALNCLGQDKITAMKKDLLIVLQAIIPNLEIARNIPILRLPLPNITMMK